MAFSKYDARNVTQGTRAKKVQSKERGIQKGPTPSDPTGRMVIVKTDGQGNGGAQANHWCPKEGTEWECPRCGEWFRRDEDRKGEPWRHVG